MKSLNRHFTKKVREQQKQTSDVQPLSIRQEQIKSTKRHHYICLPGARQDLSMPKGGNKDAQTSLGGMQKYYSLSGKHLNNF